MGLFVVMGDACIVGELAIYINFCKQWREHTHVTQ